MAIHDPEQQVSLPEQVFPQVPQLASSVCRELVAIHDPEQQVSLPEQVFPQAPQLNSSV